MFNYKHYVPILKAKRGEFNALRNLSVPAKTNITPVIEVYTDEEFETNGTVYFDDVSTRITTDWGLDTPIFIEVNPFDPAERINNVHPVTLMFQELRSKGVYGIPVTSFDRDVDYQNAIRDVIATDHRGVMLRITEDDFGDLVTPNILQPLRDLLGVLHIENNATDLLLDFDYNDFSQRGRVVLMIRTLYPVIPNITSWRTITIASTSFPQSMSGFSTTINPSILPRVEWNVWNSLLPFMDTVGRKSSFGDYAINFPDLPTVDPRFMRPSTNIRYSTITDWLIFKGASFRAGGASFRGLSQQVTQHRDYRGQAYSWGDDYIFQCSNGTVGTGNLTTWRAVGTNHHLTVVAEQVSNVP